MSQGLSFTERSFTELGSTELGFTEQVRSLELELVRELGLAALRLPDELAVLEGTFRGEAVRLEARAYAGPSVRYARFVELRGPELEIGNVAVFPRAELDLPLLGVDLVGLGKDSAVVVADLSPMQDEAGAHAAQIEALRAAQGSDAVSAGRAELPAWAAEWFSTAALSVRVPSEQARDAARCVGAFAAAFLVLARRATADAERAEAVSIRQHAYAAAHRERDRGLGLLRRMFEPGLADRFLRGVLFPERIPA